MHVITQPHTARARPSRPTSRIYQEEAPSTDTHKKICMRENKIVPLRHHPHHDRGDDGGKQDVAKYR